MKLYEALKCGTSAEDLEASFHKQLAAAQERIAKEKNEEARIAHLKECRTALSAALSDYIIALIGDENRDFVDINEIEEKLLEYEVEETMKLLNTTKRLKTFKVPTGTGRDDDIIKAFLDSLR